MPGASVPTAITRMPSPRLRASSQHAESSGRLPLALPFVSDPFDPAHDIASILPGGEPSSIANSNRRSCLDALAIPVPSDDRCRAHRKQHRFKLGCRLALSNVSPRETRDRVDLMRLQTNTDEGIDRGNGGKGVMDHRSRIVHGEAFGIEDVLGAEYNDGECGDRYRDLSSVTTDCAGFSPDVKSI